MVVIEARIRSSVCIRMQETAALLAALKVPPLGNLPPAASSMKPSAALPSGTKLLPTFLSEPN
eukprot:5521296-Amphidinium_carterae.1